MEENTPQETNQQITITKTQAFKIFSSDSYLAINKDLLRVYGPEKAIFISNLIDKFLYFKTQNKLEDDWFFQIHENQISETGMTEYAIRKCKVAFQEDGILEIKRKGIPAKEWYKINIGKMISLFGTMNKGQVLAKSLGQEHAVSIGHILLKNSNNNELIIKESISKDIQGTVETVQLNNDNILTTKSRRQAPNRNESQLPIKVEPPKANLPIERQAVKKEFLQETWKHMVLENWNKLEGDISHHNDLTTKTAARVDEMLEHLRYGAFFDRHHIDPEFMKRNRIPENWQKERKQFTIRQLMAAVSKYQLYWKDGYWPLDKKGLPKSLSEFIYNPRQNTSFMLRILANPEVMPLSEESRNKDKNPKYTELFREAYLLEKVAERDMGPLVYGGINKILKFIRESGVFVTQGETSWLTDLYVDNEKEGYAKFFDAYVAWLRNTSGYDWRDLQTMEKLRWVFSPTSILFKQFLSWFAETKVKNMNWEWE